MLHELSNYPKVVVELGIGDGRLLEELARHDTSSFFIGIELNEEHCREAKSRIGISNVAILPGSFEDIVPVFPAQSIDRFIVILPDPKFIDEKKESSWKQFYKLLYSKLRKGGILELVTEITDELLRPVSDDAYEKWALHLRSSFLTIGFALQGQYEGAPVQYSSRCLDQFSGDKERIRMLTLELSKP